MPESLTILQNDPTFNPELSFEQLRSRGLQHIAEISGEVWSDHNLHDPGITILEVLCYAIADLAYRNQLPLEDLLAKSIEPQQKEDNFLTPEQILSCNPLTIFDYRKMLMDIDGIKNAWLEIAHQAETDLYINCADNRLQFEKEGGQKLVLNGLYKVFLELENTHPALLNQSSCEDGEANFSQIIQQVQHKLHSHRNLCEDFVEVVVLQDEQIGICGEIELNADADPDETLLNIFNKIQAFLSPNLKFYSLQEMLHKGKSIEEIFAGRPLSPESHGFIDPDDLEQQKRRTELHTSDLYRVIMQAEGVRAIKDLHLVNYFDGVPQTTGEPWCLKLTDLHRPVLAPELSIINFFKGVLPFRASKTKAIKSFQKRLANFQKVKLPSYQLDLDVPQGRYRKDLSEHRSILHDFPLTYAVGHRELPDSSTALRKAQVQQLRAYLLFFDQLLSNYLYQLSHIRALFSISPDSQKTEESQRTYFAQRLEDLPGAEELLRFYDPQNTSNHKTADFQFKEVIADFWNSENEQTFSDPETRDQRLAYTIQMFNNQDFVVETRQENCGFCFIIKDQYDQSLLKSRRQFETEFEAKQIANRLSFVASEAQAYKKINRQKQGNYTFQLCYHPVDYWDYLKQITENKATYHQRRDTFLNHLLARFGEHFTDYVLLMFALDGKRKEPAKILEDKAHFLSQYPDISRNRGRAFDYTQIHKLWNTDNVSGLEKRVPALMGIQDWKRQNLSNLQVVKRKDIYHFNLLDHKGCSILAGEAAYPTATAAEAAFQEFIRQLLEGNLYHFKNIDCRTDSVYRFSIVDAQDCLLARHPFSYDTADKRDKAKNNILTFLRNLAFLIDISHKVEGYFFEWLDDEGELIFISFKSESTAAKAQASFLQFMEAASDITNWEIRNPTDTEQTFVIKNKNLGNILAIHPTYYPSDEVEEKKQAIFEQFEALYLAPAYAQNPPAYSWQLFNQEADQLLESFAQFGTGHQVQQEQSAVFQSSQQSTQAFLYFLEQYHPAMPLIDATDDLAFYIQSPLGILARSVVFDSVAAQEAAKESLSTQLQAIQSYFKKSLITYPAACYVELLDTNRNLLLKSTTYYKDLAFVHQDKAQLKTVLQQEGALILKEDNAALEYYLELQNNKGQVIARSEKSPRKSDIEAIQSNIQNLVAQQQFYFSDAGLEQELYAFLLLDEQEYALLETVQLFSSKTAALEAYLDIYSLTKTAANFEKTATNKPSFSYRLNQQDTVVATYPYSFKFIEDRDQYLKKTIRFFKAHTPLLHIPKKAGSFYFFIKKDTDLLLKSIQTYTTEDAVKQAWWEFLRLGCQPEYFQKITDDDGCQDSFIFKTPEHTWAIHPHFYPRSPEGMTSLELRIEDAMTLLCQHRFPYQIRPEKRKWHLSLKMLDCDFSFETILISTDYDTLEELEDHRENWITTIRSNFNQLDVVKISETEGFQISLEPEKTAWFPGVFSCKRIATYQLKKIKAYLNAYANITGFTPHIKHTFDFREVKKEERQSRLDLDEAYGFRLIKEDDIIAKHPTTYPTARQRDKQLERLLKNKKTFKNKYSRVSTAGVLTVEIPKEEQVKILCADTIDKYRFLIIDAKSQAVLWESVETFITKEAAQTAFRQQYISIIQLARIFRFYQQTTEPKSVFLLDKKGKKLARIPSKSFEEQSLEEAIETRRNHALAFPITQENEQYSFQFFNIYSQQNIWKSSETFKSLEEAWTAFECFLDLLLYAPNWHKTGYRATGYSFVLKHILLDSQFLYASEDEAWHVTKEALQDSQQEWGLYPYTNYEDSCRYGFRSVAPSYRLAQHPHLFYTQEEREITLNWLQCYAKCVGFRCLSVFSDTKCIGGLYYYQIKVPSDENNKGAVLWQSRTSYDNEAAALRAYEDNYIHILQLAKDPAYYHFIDNGTACYTIALQNETGNIVAILPKKFPATKTEERLKAVIHQIEEARHFPIHPTNDGFKFELYALEFDRKNLKETPCSNRTKKQLNPDLVATFPSDSAEKGESFLIDHIQQLVGGEIVWKSLRTYPKVWDAYCSVELLKDGVEDSSHVSGEVKAVGLLQEPLSYQRVAIQSDCGPFQLEIVNPKCIRAEHPRTYVLASDRDEAMEDTLNCMNVEGFHLLEHILLRPLKAAEEEYFAEVEILKKEQNEMDIQSYAAQDLMSICVEDDCCGTATLEESLSSQSVLCGLEKEEKTEEDVLFDNYLPGADPYSFWLTVVLPYWPNRFLNPNFRMFFEDTLRREIPAHAALRMVWVNPQQMQLFEKSYKNWLQTLSSDANCNRIAAQRNLLKVLASLRNEYLPATLHDCEEDSSGGNVFLNQTQLG